MTQASYLQHGMWMADRESGAAAYHMPLILHLGDEVDVGALSDACAALVDRHALLATALADRGGAARLVPAETAPGLRIAGADERIEDEIARDFDLDRGPLIRFALFGSDLVVTAHHSVFDGHSKDVLVRDLGALREGTRLGLLPPNGYAQHAEAERWRVERALPEARAFWQPRWSEPGPVIVRDAVLDSRRAGAGAVTESALPKPAVPGLTTFEVTMAALHALLFSYGNSRVVTAVDLSTRTPETADLIGPFVNELPLASEPSGDLAFRQFGLGLRAELRELYRFREVPLARAVARVRPYAALAPVSVSYRKRAGRPGDDVQWLVFNGAVRGDLQLQLVDTGDKLVSSLRYSAKAAPVAPRLVDDLARVLLAVTRNPGERLADLLTLESGRNVVEAPQAAPAGSASAAEPTSSPAAEPAAGPAGELVEAVREIWQQVLGIERIELHDDLFELGGHSLTITRIIALMQERLGVDVQLDDLFDNPTIVGALDAAGLR
jgi:acyl carrier protein